jgi:hypothetical protein
MAEAPKKELEPSNKQEAEEDDKDEKDPAKRAAKKKEREEAKKKKQADYEEKLRKKKELEDKRKADQDKKAADPAAKQAEDAKKKAKEPAEIRIATKFVNETPKGQKKGMYLACFEPSPPSCGCPLRFCGSICSFACAVSSCVQQPYRPEYGLHVVLLLMPCCRCLEASGGRV